MAHHHIVVDEEISARGIITYSTELVHDELGKHRRIKDRDYSTVVMRAEFQLKQWDEQWAKKQAREKAARERANAQEEKEKAQSLAVLRTDEAKQRLSGIEHTLDHTLAHDDTVDWNSLKDRSEFPTPRPALKLPRKPVVKQLPSEPNRKAPRYQPVLKLLDKLSAKRRAAREKEARDRFARARGEWQKKVDQVRRHNTRMKDKHDDKVAQVKMRHRNEVAKWKQARSKFLEKQREKNEKIDAQRADWKAGKCAAVEAYCDMVLSNSQYDECCPQEFELEFNRDNRILIVDYQLPAPNALPTLTEVKYIISRKAFTEKHLPQTKQRKLYDDLLYQISLRTIHELFEADTVEALSAVVFNGYVTSIDKGTGKETTACVLSVQADREAFGGISLGHIDPKGNYTER